MASRLTEVVFNTTIETFYLSMTQFVDEYGVVPLMVVGLGTDGDVVLSVGFYREDTEATEQDQEDDGDALMFPGTPSDHLDTLRDLLAQAGAVAVISVGSAWVVDGDAARDVDTRGIPVDEHPAREESLIVVGHYPLHMLTRVLTGRIAANERGVLAVHPWPTPGLARRRAAGLIEVVERVMFPAGIRLR